MSSVRLLFTNGSNTVRAGGIVSGVVECNFNTEKKVNAIQIKFKGKSNVRWRESEQEYNNQRQEYEYKDVDYTAEESYLNFISTLYTAENSTKIPAGKRTYPFRCKLPADIPSSFEGTYGHIRYSAKAIVNRSWKSNFEDKRDLQILPNLDLNSLPNLREPVAISLDETMCSCCCASPEILTFNLSLPATGFVPGQAVSIGCHINNMTNANVELVKLKIVKKLEFISRHPSTHIKKEKYVLSQIEEGKVGAHGEKSWTTTLRIPANGKYPDLRFCKIMDMTYRLQVKAVMLFPNSDIESTIPLTIGAIPLSGVATTFAGNAPREETTATAPIDEITATAPLDEFNAPLEGATAPPINITVSENIVDTSKIGFAVKTSARSKDILAPPLDTSALPEEATASPVNVTVSSGEIVDTFKIGFSVKMSDGAKEITDTSGEASADKITTPPEEAAVSSVSATVASAEIIDTSKIGFIVKTKTSTPSKKITAPDGEGSTPHGEGRAPPEELTAL